MRFKVDENLPVEAVELPRTAEHDALSIHDQQMVGSLDPHVASICQSEGRALLTLDLDFSDIRSYPPGDYHGIIVLRPRNQAKPSVLRLLNQLIPLLATEPLRGNLWIVQETGCGLEKVRLDHMPHTDPGTNRKRQSLPSSSTISTRS